MTTAPLAVLNAAKKLNIARRRFNSADQAAFVNQWSDSAVERKRAASARLDEVLRETEAEEDYNGGFYLQDLEDENSSTWYFRFTAKGDPILREEFVSSGD